MQTFSQTKTAQLMNASRSTHRNWLMRSKREKEAGLEATSELYFEFEGKTKWFHQHASASVRYSVELLEESLRHWAIYGTEKVVRDTRGNPVWKRDLRLVGRPDLQELAGVPDDLLRVDGCVVAETIVERPPFDGAMKFLAAYAPRFRPKSDSQIDINHQISGGVMIIGAPQASPKEKIAARLPELEVIEPDSFEDEIAAAGDTNVSTEPEPEPESPAPSGPNPNVNRARTPMREQLEAIARSKDADRLEQMARAGGMKVV
jgi:hypothetical protein